MSTAVKQCESLPGLKIGVPPPLFSAREGGPPETCGTIRRAAWMADNNHRQQRRASSDGKTTRPSKSVITGIGPSDRRAPVSNEVRAEFSILSVPRSASGVTSVPPKHRPANPDAIRLPSARPHPGSIPYFPGWVQRTPQVTSRTTRLPPCQNL